MACIYFSDITRTSDWLAVCLNARSVCVYSVLRPDAKPDQHETDILKYLSLNKVKAKRDGQNKSWALIFSMQDQKKSIEKS